ncbi:MAG: hypothetical protein Q9211_001284 [Gyalolechia sp. 1 TL-2023]
MATLPRLPLNPPISPKHQLKSESPFSSSLSSPPPSEDEESAEEEVTPKAEEATDEGDTTEDEPSFPGADDNPSENDPSESEECENDPSSENEECTEEEEEVEQSPPPPRNTPKFKATPELRSLLQKVREHGSLQEKYSKFTRLWQLAMNTQAGLVPRQTARDEIRRILVGAPDLREEWVKYLDDSYGILDPSDVVTEVVGQQAGAAATAVASSSGSNKKRTREEEASEEEDSDDEYFPMRPTGAIIRRKGLRE